METPFFFENNNYNLFGVLHEPEPNKHKKLNEPNKPPMGLVFCHPFAEEKLISHRVMVNLARILAKEGIYCLRFDYMGHGDSDGDFEDATIETRLSDIHCAISYLKYKYNLQRIGLLGVRFGATLAALLCQNNDEINHLILISPLIEGKPYIYQCLRSNLTTQIASYKKVIKDRKGLINDLINGGTVNIDGHILTKTLYQQIEEINLLEGSATCPKEMLIVQIARRENQPLENGLKKLHDIYRSQGAQVELLGVKEDYFWADSKQYNPHMSRIELAVVTWLRKRSYA